jgi:hypothetical protein
MNTSCTNEGQLLLPQIGMELWVSFVQGERTSRNAILMSMLVVLVLHKLRNRSIIRRLILLN